MNDITNNLKIIYKKTIDLIPYISNPRNNTEAIDKVASSIKNFGFKVPIVIDSNSEIIAGHTRLKAAKKLKLEEVPCIIADDLNDAQVKAFRIADNKVAEFSEWDMELLKSELEELSFEDFDMSDFGFDDMDFEIESNEAVEDDFNIEENFPEEPISKYGQIYQLGRHRLMCGDSTKAEDVEKLMNGDKADLLITDPPYNVDYEGKTKDNLKIENDNMNNEEFKQFLYNAFNVANTFMREGAVFYIWHADSEGYNFRAACNEVGWKIRQCLIWNKNTIVMGRQDYHWKHEPCLYGWKDGAAHLWNSNRKQSTVIDYDKPSRNGEHPTMKPVGLFDYQIKNNTKKGNKVLDLFAGSGTTIIACENNKRNAYCMELDPRYVDVIIKRWEEHTGVKAELII